MTNPILAFSGRRRMRSIRTPILLTAYSLALAAVACLAIYMPFLGKSFSVSDLRGSVLGYAGMLALQFVLIVLVAPAMTSGAISGERERQTLDLLMVTGTGAFRIVIGKLLESFGFLALMILCSLPMMSLVLLTGGATVLQVLTGVAFLLLVALAASSVGLFCSSLLKRTVSSTVVSYVAVLGVGLITLLPIWYDVKRIGDTYDAMNIAGRTIASIDIFPVSFTLNPGLGLFSILQDQTGVFDSVLWGVSYTLANTWRYLHFDLYVLYNMAFMLVASVLLTLLSAFNLRANSNAKPGRRRGV